MGGQGLKHSDVGDFDFVGQRGGPVVRGIVPEAYRKLSLKKCSERIALKAVR